MKEKLVVVVGPTASGKSALAMQLAERFNGELICADSRTIYKGMDIGTAKPDIKDQRKVAHHLLDLLEPGSSFSAAEFKFLAEKSVVDITSRSKLPIMVGGTGLYIDAVIFDYHFGRRADTNLRAKLSQLNIMQLQLLCKERGIQLPNNSQNKRHLVRAIELGGLIQEQRRLRSNTLVVGITTTKKDLQKRIELRVKDMINRGVLEEARNLAESYGWENEAMTGNVYRIAKNVLAGTLSLDDATRLFIRNDMRLAKRQTTWFNRNPNIFWSSSREELIARVDRFITCS